MRSPGSQRHPRWGCVCVLSCLCPALRPSQGYWKDALKSGNSRALCSVMERTDFSSLSVPTFNPQTLCLLPAASRCTARSRLLLVRSERHRSRVFSTFSPSTHFSLPPLPGFRAAAAFPWMFPFCCPTRRKTSSMNSTLDFVSLSVFSSLLCVAVLHRLGLCC